MSEKKSEKMLEKSRKNILGPPPPPSPVVNQMCRFSGENVYLPLRGNLILQGRMICRLTHTASILGFAIMKYGEP